MIRQTGLLTLVRDIQVPGDGCDEADGAFGLDQQGREGLGHRQRAPYIGFVSFLGILDVLVQQWHEVVAAGAVNEVCESTLRLLTHYRHRGLDILRKRHVELEEAHIVQSLDFRHGLRITRGCEYLIAVAVAVEGDGDSGTDAAIGAAGNQDGALGSHC